MADFYERNKRYVKRGSSSYNTKLGADEPKFRKWLKQNKVPFDPDAKVSDYDMRGFYKALESGDPKAASAIDPNDNRLHYPDFWKTPYHESFSNESQWATPDAPRWNDKDQLVDQSGAVVYDDRAPKAPEDVPAYANGGAVTSDDSDPFTYTPPSRTDAAPAQPADDDPFSVGGPEPTGRPYSYDDSTGETKSGDTWKAIKAGVQSGVVGPALAGGRYLAERNGAENLTTIFKNLGISSDEIAKENVEEMSPTAQRSLQAALTSPDFWAAPGRAAYLKAANMSPALVATLVPAAIVSGPAAATLMVGVANGALSAGQAAQEIYKKIDETSDADLQAQVPFYATLREWGMSEHDAREKYNQKTQGDVPLFNFLVGTAAGVAGPVAGVARVAKGGAGVVGAAERGIVGRAAVGAAEGAGTNAVQGGFENASVQDALTDAGLQKKFDVPSFGNALVEQLAVGAVLGGGAGAISRGSAPAKAPAKPARTAPTQVEVVEPGAPNAEESVALAASASPAQVAPKAPDVTPAEVTPAAEPVTSPGTPPPAVAAASERVATPEVAAPALDTGMNVPESPQTLAIQQKQLVDGQRPVQMFPKGTEELPLPAGAARAENDRGVFHYNPALINEEQIHGLSGEGRENEFLNLGPVSKPDVDARVAAGEKPLVVTEHTPDGVEVRAAAGTDQTAAAQQEFFERTKEPGNVVTVGPPPERVAQAPVPADVAAASERVEAGAPRGPRVLQAQDPAALETNRIAKKAQDAAKPRLVEEKASKGKHRTEAEIEKREADAKAAKQIFDELAPADGVIPKTASERADLHDRVTDIVERAEKAGIKLSAIKAYDGTSDHMVYLREAADLKRTLDKKGTPPARRDTHIMAFLGRERAAKSGDFSIMRAERKAEGDLAKRKTQGDVEVMAAAPAKSEPAVMRADTELATEERELSLSTPEKDAVATNVAKSAKGHVRGVSAPTEAGEVKLKTGKTEKLERAAAASPVRKVELTPEMRAKYEGTSKVTPKIVGDLPQSGVSPANIARDGTIYVGPKGSQHFEISQKYSPELRERLGLEPGEGTWKAEGFMTPDGRFLNRKEAFDWVTANEKRVAPSENMKPGELDALDYRDQVGDRKPKVTPKIAEIKERVAAAAAKAERKPTEAQKEAGNYAKGHVSVQGLDISIENPRGSTREGVGPDGKPWSVKLPDHYGYIKRTEGADGDHVDVYLGPEPDATHVFVIDQHDLATKKFDEHKVMIGYKDATRAMEAYEKAFSDGKGFERMGLIKPMTMDEFKAWLKQGDTTKAAANIPAMAHAPKPKGAEPVEFDGTEIKPLYTATGKEVLKGLSFDHLEGPAAKLVPFLSGQMAKAVENTKIHIVSNAEMAKAIGDELPTFGMWVPDNKNGRGGDYIMLNADQLQTQEQFVHTMVHETVHMVMVREVERNPEYKATIRSLMNEVRGKLSDLDGQMPEFARYAFTNEHEFLAEAFSNPDFQQLLSETPLSAYNAERIGLHDKIRPTLWDYFVASAKKVIRGLGVPEGSFSALEGALRIGKNVMRDAEMRTDPVNPVNPANVRPHALTAAEVKERARDLRTNAGGKTRVIKDKLSSAIMLGKRAEHFLPGASKVVELKAMMEREKSRILHNEGGTELVRDIAAYEREHGTAEFERLAGVGFDASNSNVNLGPKADNTHLGKDATEGWQAKARLAALQKRFDALPEEGQALLGRAVAFFKKVQNDIALQDIKNILQVAGVNEAGLAERIHTDGLTEADKAKFKTNTVVNALNEAREIKQIQGWYLPFRRYGEYVVNAYHEVKAPKNGLKVADDTVQFADTVKGSDTAARRMAQVYVEGHELRHVATKKVWVDKTDPSKIVPAEDVNAVPAYRVKLQRQSTEFFDSESMARRVQEDLVKSGEMEQVDGVRKRSDYVGQSANALSGQMHTVMTALEKQDRFKAMSAEERAAVRQTINEASVRVLGSTRLQSTFQQRRNVAGYSEDLGRVTADYARAATGYLAKLRFQPRLDEAFNKLHAYNDAHKFESSDRTIRRDELVSELRRRIYDETPSDAQTTFGKFSRRLLQVSRLDKLAGVSFHVINSQEPWTTSAPVIGGRHGLFATLKTMGNVYNLIGARAAVVAGIKDTVRAFSKDNGFADYLAMFKNEIQTSPMVGGTKAKRLASVLDYADDRGIFSDEAVFEVSKYSDPTKGKLLRGLDRADLMANQVGNAIEKINRTVTLLTAYELEFKKNGGNHEAAMHYAYEVTHDTMGDYSTWNSSPLFRSNAGMLALQFKKFAHKTYYLLGNTLRGTIQGDPEAAKQFIGLMVTHAVVAGAMGLPLEPFKVALMAANALGVTGFTWQDFELVVREQAAGVLGTKGGEMFTHGLTRGLGVDTSARQGLDSLMTFGAPKDAAKLPDLKAWLFDTVAGAPAGWLLDQVRSAQALSKGDLAKAVELTVPVKGLTDVWKAYMGLSPKLDAKGRVMQPGYSGLEAAAKAIGLTPASEAENYEKRSMFAAQSKKGSDARAALITAWVNAKPSEKSAALKATQEWNKTQPANVRIFPKDLIAAGHKRAKEPEGLRATKRDSHILSRLTPVYGNP